MKPSAERRAMDLSPDTTPNHHIKDIADALERAYKDGEEVAYSNARLFVCAECGERFNVRNQEEFEGKDVCNLCHEELTEKWQEETAKELLEEVTSE